MNENKFMQQILNSVTVGYVLEGRTIEKQFDITINPLKTDAFYYDLYVRYDLLRGKEATFSDGNSEGKEVLFASSQFKKILFQLRHVWAQETILQGKRRKKTQQGIWQQCLERFKPQQRKWAVCLSSLRQDSPHHRALF